jgi:acyl-CoA reductase-like NAD-dependent aldehyde dehydrogenase
VELPDAIAAWGFAPALAAGNTVVLKPAELTPLTAIRLGELALQAGLPDGVLQVVPGKGSVVGQRFVDHPDVRKIVFTGSTQVGKQVMAGCAQQVKRVTLELGGKNANIVFADADLERAAATAPYAVFDNAGQDCCAASRILVQRSVFDRFMRAARAGRCRASASRTRRGRAPEMGPPPQRAANRERVASYVP